MPSLFVNAMALVPEESLSIQEIVQRLKKPTRDFAQAVELLRVENDEDEQDKLKKALPAVTWSGEFSKRAASGLETHTGLYVYDLDNVKPSALKKKIADEPSLVVAFMSPRANGLKVVLRGPVPNESLTHKEAWQAGAVLVEGATGESVDRSGSDVARLCFLSTDKFLVEGTGDEFAIAVDGRNSEPAAEDKIMDGVPEPKTDYSAYNKYVVKEMLWTVGADLPYDQWRNIIWAVVSHFGKREWVREMLLEWSKKRGGAKALKTEADEKTFHSIVDSKGEGVTFASMIAMARKAGWVDWRKLLRRDEDDELIIDEGNLKIILCSHPDFKGRFWSDSITGLAVMEPIADPVSCVESRVGGVLEDEIAMRVLCDLQTHVCFHFRSVRSVMLALMTAAKGNVRNMRAEWLESLTWDGVPRVGRMFIECFGAEDLPRNEALAVSFMAGAAARIMRPGASVQVIPILMGQQGCGKSSGIAALCPERAWFCDSFVDMESKSGYEVVQRAAIVELSELSAMRKASIEKLKQFVTQSCVNFRAPYDRQTKDHLASWVFIGTTNESEFLKDTTGNRRFAPIKIVRAKVSEVVQAVTDQRDQLWAEAVVIAKRGFKNRTESWAVPKKFWDELGDAAEEARERDPLEDVVNEYTERALKKHNIVVKSLHDIQLEAHVEIRGHADQWRLGKVLRMAGWKNQAVRVDGITVKRWIIRAL